MAIKHPKRAYPVLKPEGSEIQHDLFGPFYGLFLHSQYTLWESKKVCWLTGEGERSEQAENSLQFEHQKTCANVLSKIINYLDGFS